MSILGTILKVSGITNPNKAGEDSGLIGLIKEKSGKISFKRVGGVMVIAFAIKDEGAHELNLMNGGLMIAALIAVAFGDWAKNK